MIIVSKTKNFKKTLITHKIIHRPEQSIIRIVILIFIPNIDPKHLIPSLGQSTDSLNDLN